MTEERSGFGLIVIGIMMLLYVMGALVTGSLGLAVVLGSITAHFTPLTPYAAIAMWTGIYILVMITVLGLGIYMEVSN